MIDKILYIRSDDLVLLLPDKSGQRQRQNTQSDADLPIPNGVSKRAGRTAEKKILEIYADAIAWRGSEAIEQRSRALRDRWSPTTSK
jgi:hypothetical protein